MKFTFDMTVGKLLENPKSRSVFEKYTPQLVHHPMIGMVKHFKLKDLMQYAGKANISQETVKKIQTELESLS